MSEASRKATKDALRKIAESLSERKNVLDSGVAAGRARIAKSNSSFDEAIEGFKSKQNQHEATADLRQGRSYENMQNLFAAQDNKESQTFWNYVKNKEAGKLETRISKIQRRADGIGVRLKDTENTLESMRIADKKKADQDFARLSKESSDSAERLKETQNQLGRSYWSIKKETDRGGQK